MKTEKFLHAMNEIDEKYIKQADIFAPVPVTEPKSGRVFYRMAGALACAVMIFGIAFFGSKAFITGGGSVNEGYTADTTGAAGNTADTASEIDNEDSIGEGAGVLYGDENDTDGSVEYAGVEIESQDDPSEIHGASCAVQIATEKFWAERLERGTVAAVNIDLNQVIAYRKRPIDDEGTVEQMDGAIVRTRNIADLSAVDSEADSDACEEYYLVVERDGKALEWVITEVYNELGQVVVPDDYTIVNWIVSRNDDGDVTVCDTYDMDNGLVRYITLDKNEGYSIIVKYDENDLRMDEILTVTDNLAREYLREMCKENNELKGLYFDRVEITHIDEDSLDKAIAKFCFSVELKDDKKYTGDADDEITYYETGWADVDHSVKLYKEGDEWKCAPKSEVADAGASYSEVKLVRTVGADFTPLIDGSIVASAVEEPVQNETADDCQG